MNEQLNNLVAEFQLTEEEVRIIQVFDALQGECFRNSFDKGFWTDQMELLQVLKSIAEPDKRDRLAKAANNAFHAMKRDLMVSEIGEACEAARKDLPADKLPEIFSGEEEEHADLFIRGLDYAGKRHFKLGLAIVLKMRYNSKRPHMHGKAF